MLAALIACACTSGATPFGGPHIVAIGVDLPLTGADGISGTATLNGIQYYVHQHPTVDGKQISLVIKDDAVKGTHNPERGAANIQALIANPDVVGIIGPFDSNVARAEVPIANQASLTMISPSASDTCLTKDVFLPSSLNVTAKNITCSDASQLTAKELRPVATNNFFRLATTDDYQGPAAADYAYNALHLLKVAVMSDGEVYGQALASGFSIRFVKNGGSVVDHADFNPAPPPDYATFLKKAKADGAQAIYFGGVTSNGVCSARAAMKGIFDAKAPFLGGDGIAEDPACVTAAGAEAVGIYATVPAISPDSLPAAQPTIKAFKAAYPGKSDYDAYTMAAYDATGVLIDAIHRAFASSGGKIPTRAAVIAQVAFTSYPGVIGLIAFTPEGDITTKIVSVYESLSTDPLAAWPLQGAIDYSAKPPA